MGSLVNKLVSNVIIIQPEWLCSDLILRIKKRPLVSSGRLVSYPSSRSMKSEILVSLVPFHFCHIFLDGLFFFFFTDQQHIFCVYDNEIVQPL